MAKDERTLALDAIALVRAVVQEGEVEDRAAWDIMGEYGLAQSPAGDLVLHLCHAVYYLARKSAKHEGTTPEAILARVGETIIRRMD